MERRLGDVARPYKEGKSGAYMRAARVLTMGGAVGGLLVRRSRALSAAAGAATRCGSSKPS